MWFETQYTACEDLRLSFEGLGDIDSANPRELPDCRMSSLVLFNPSLALFGIGDVPEFVVSVRAWEFEVWSCVQSLPVFSPVRLAFSVSVSHLVLPVP